MGQRTIHVRVAYRVQIPDDVPLERIMLNNAEVAPPPMIYSTGSPGTDGGQGTWRTQPLPDVDFLTYSFSLGEGDGWDLAKVQDLLKDHECGPPDIVNGYDMCPCGRGEAWPCEITRAAWIARGLDVDHEVTTYLRSLRDISIAELEGWS